MAMEGPYVPMDHIIALFELHAIPGMSALERGFPRAVRELVHTLQISGLLYSSAGLHPLGLLSTADARQCRSRRAEAIMSAIGATRWYHEIPRTRHEQHLVLGLYPVQFLREVRGLFGDAFFSSQFALCCEFWDVYEDVAERLRRPREDQAGPVATASTDPRGVFVVGTMLPFNQLRCSSRRWGLNWPHSPESERSLPSNRTWELGDDGRVIMREVSLIASSDRDFYPPQSETDHRMWRIYGPDIDNPRQITEHQNSNIHEYLRSQLVPSLPGRAKHGILTISNFAKVTGVVLMQVYNDEEPVKTFAKIADFELDVKRQAGSVSKMIHRFVSWEVFAGDMLRGGHLAERRDDSGHLVRGEMRRVDARYLPWCTSDVQRRTDFWKLAVFEVPPTPAEEFKQAVQRAQGHDLDKRLRRRTELIELPPVEFIWLDVACIDQRRDEPGSVLEIGRQAQIFKGAQNVFIWLCTLAGNDLRRLLDRIPRIATATRIYPRDPTTVPLSDKIGSMQALHADVSKLVSDPWFTSLWTLQEIFLRPDCVFLSKDAKVAVKNREEWWDNVPVPLEFRGVLNFTVNSSTRMRQYARGTPAAVETAEALLRLLEKAGLMAIASLNFMAALPAYLWL
ncbi:hypothetical protein diail_5928 [Diaporthe ilicicola]|nr:hypothetical protein diail_5928 [Diaporthe ilicicola]